MLARLKKLDRSPEVCEAAYIAGRDDAHSAVRQGLEISPVGSRLIFMSLTCRRRGGNRSDVEWRNARRYGPSTLGACSLQYIGYCVTNDPGTTMSCTRVKSERAHGR